MLETLATLLVAIVALYFACGIGFALFFAWRGVGVIDPAAQEGTWGFKLLILPGCAALWPLLLSRYRDRQPPREERNPHRDLARPPTTNPEPDEAASGPE